jgi:carbon-monoxide dehydrogenase large subunit
MNIRVGVEDLSQLKFGVGQSVRRCEDPTLVQGKGSYTDDVQIEGQLFGAFVRSPYAHGVIRRLDTSAAAAMPGVAGVFTARDLEGRGHGDFRSIVNFPNRDGSPMGATPRQAFASDRVRFVGDLIALVVASSAVEARDAAEAVEVEIDPLPVVVSVEDALAPGAPALYESVPGNCVLDYHYGDAAKVAEAFAAAAHVTKLRLSVSRVVVSAMEPRSALAIHDAATGRFTIHVESQGVRGMRGDLAHLMGVRADRIRVLTGQVGGSFGMKALGYGEYVAILRAAEALGRPVKWTDTRSESFVSDHQGRDMAFEAELALDAEGRFLATRFTGHGNVGAYLSPFAVLMPSIQIVKNGVGMYRTPLMEVRSLSVLTNTVPVGAYRGAGRPEGNYFMERVIDVAAAELGLDRIELRRRNLIAPDQMPWRTPAATVYDSGDFPGLLAKALEAADWEGYPARREASRLAGRLRGRGIGCFLEMTAGPSNELGGIHFEADGSVTILTGTLDFGQGHATTFAQVVNGELGIPHDRIRLKQGDSDLLIAGGFSGGSKSIMSSGTAFVEASAKVIEKGKVVASHLLEAAESDIEFRAGRFAIAGTDRSIGLLELAAELRAGVKLPPHAPRTLDVDHLMKAVAPSFPNGCHIAEVEIDPETGVVQVVRYVTVNDFGVLVNPLIVEGQLHGGIVQGIGQCLSEEARFDESGQLLTGSFMDYAMPRAEDAPSFVFIDRGTPATTNVLGVKGCGEAGCAGALPSVMGAVADALSPFGVRHVEMPATPQKIWRIIQEARARSA